MIFLFRVVILFSETEVILPGDMKYGLELRIIVCLTERIAFSGTGSCHPLGMETVFYLQTRISFLGRI
jgi:hypothetical protein